MGDLSLAYICGEKQCSPPGDSDRGGNKQRKANDGSWQRRKLSGGGEEEDTWPGGDLYNGHRINKSINNE